MEATEFTAEDVLKCFNDGFLALFFPELKGPEAQEYLLAMAHYVMDCGNGQYIAEHCPKIFCCWASHYMAWLLATWATADITDGGEVCLTDPAACKPAQYLKSKEVGNKKCQWDIIDMSKTCCPCPPKAWQEWEAKWKELIECCRIANSCPFIVGGSWMPENECKPKGCGCGADYWNYG